MAYGGLPFPGTRCPVSDVVPNVYEMINTRNSLIAYIKIYKFIVHLVCGYNMDDGGYCNPLTVCGFVFGVCIALLLIVTFDWSS